MSEADTMTIMTMAAAMRGMRSAQVFNVIVCDAAFAAHRAP
ncbi:MAG: hypothetical protein WBA37_08715 [Xanthobacteraceae bacterium]|jgi:hypothetical protein